MTALTAWLAAAHKSLSVSVYVHTLHQDFADIISQPSLEGTAGSGVEEMKEKDQEESNESSFLSPAAMNTLVKVHQCLCLGYAQSLWYQGTAPVSHQKEAIKALVSSYQIVAPVMSCFYHLFGWYLVCSHIYLILLNIFKHIQYVLMQIQYYFEMGPG